MFVGVAVRDPSGCIQTVSLNGPCKVSCGQSGRQLDVCARNAGRLRKANASSMRKLLAFFFAEISDPHDNSSRMEVGVRAEQ